VSRGIALLFSRTFGTRTGWAGQPRAPATSTPGKDPVPILQKAGWAPGPVWTGGKSRPHQDSIPDRLARSAFAIPTELPAPLNKEVITQDSVESVFSEVCFAVFVSRCFDVHSEDIKNICHITQC
jgi:hypothetical protein